MGQGRTEASDDVPLVSDPDAAYLCGRWPRVWPPNDRDQIKAGLYRNRAATDILEPGSSIKPFIIAAALESGQFHADSDTGSATRHTYGRRR